MGKALTLRVDFDSQKLRQLARTGKDVGQARRLLSLAEIYDGSSRSKAALVGGVGVQIVRDWVERFNAHGPDGLIDGKSSGKPSRLNDAQRQALVSIVEAGPDPQTDGVVRWRLCDLVTWLEVQFSITLDETTVSRELKRQGYTRLTARPRHHAQDQAALEAFKKGALPPGWQKSVRVCLLPPL